MVRIGTGYDVHALVENRPLIIGGVTIAHSKGCWAIPMRMYWRMPFWRFLGACLGEYWDLFPDTDPKYKDADSIVLLKEVYALIQSKGYKLSNLDAVIIAQMPKFKPHISHSNP